MSFELARKNYLTNLFGILASISAFPYIFIFPYTYLVVSTILFITISMVCLFLNKKGFHTLAKHGLLLNATIYLFITASSFGRAAGEHLIYLPVIFGAVLLYEFSEIKNLIFSIVVVIISLVTLELTDYSLFSNNLTPQEQLEYYYGNLGITFTLSIVIALLTFKFYEKQNKRNEQIIRTSEELESTITYFSTSLYGKNTVDEILWDIAKNCISQLGFQDCVIYMINEETKQLEQKAAYGPKNPKEFEIDHAISIPVGKGIVGTVGQTGIAEIINDTSKDERYILDDERRYAEITVPIMYRDKVIGVIDSEHANKNFFTEVHLKVLTMIAALASNKIVKAIAEEERLRSTIDRLEAEKIREVNRLKSYFFSHISHEFRTPLTLILGPLEEMLRKSSDPDQQKEFKMMQSNGKKLLRLINDLLELSKFDEGKINLNATPGDIFHLCRTIVNSFHSQAVHREVDLKATIPDEPFIFSFDSSKIETILINLISNALEFSPKRSEISIKAQSSLNRIEVTINHTIGPHVQESWNDIEEQGIGFALSKELAVMHGGTIHITRDTWNVSFTLSLPASATTLSVDEVEPVLPVAPEGIPEHDVIEFERKRPVVLIVEDSDQLRAFLRRILMDDFELLEASNGKEGVRIGIESIPDLIISDIMMPEMDGKQLCYLVKSTEVTSHIPVLLLTALADLDSKLEGLEMGADYYLAKPFEPRELLTVSNNLISQRKNLREQFSKKILLKEHDWQGMSADEIFLQKLMGLVEENLANPDFNVEDLQKELGISRMQLHRKLKALTDKSATEFVRTIRLKIAAERLQRGVDNVSQIAYQVGFNSLSYFTKCFKEQFGVLPSAYGEKKSLPSS